MKLSYSEKQSQLWIKLEAHFNELLESDRRALEKITNSAEQTAIIRGRIKRTREIIAMASKETENLIDNQGLS